MKLTALTIAALSSIAGGAVAFLVVRAMSVGSPELSFVVGAVLGSQVGAIMHHRQPGSRPTVAAKAALAVVLAACALVMGTALHLTASPFAFAEISVFFAAAGSFVFPFLLLDTMWKALSKDADSSRPPHN